MSFPLNPVDKQRYKNYTYDITTKTWKSDFIYQDQIDFSNQEGGLNSADIPILNSTDTVQDFIDDITTFVNTVNSRTITAGDGLTGGGDLSADRTLAVDSTVIRTSGDQTIGGVKTFSSAVELNVAGSTTTQAVRGDRAITVDTSGIATGGSPTALDLSVNRSWTIDVPGTDLAEGTRTTTTVPITSSTGADATLSAATTALAGVMVASDKEKLDGIVLTTSATDTTAGRVTKVGDFGLGSGSGVSDIFNVGSLSTYPAPGFYAFQGDVPVASRIVGVMANRTANTRAFIIGADEATESVFFRRSNTAGVWNNWTEVVTLARYPSDTGWTTVTSLLNGWTGTVRYIKRAGMVTVTFEVLNGSSKTDNVFINLPSGYRPSVAIRGGSFSTTQVPNELTVSTSGNVASGSVATDTRGSITYPVIT